jgi:ubiquinone/menaquinone biosynthesis C-methylase UbiE
MENKVFTEKDVHSFWNSRAALGVNAGSNDVTAKQIEIEAIASYAKDGMRILDFGCGSGVTALELACRYDIDLLGIDYAEEMVNTAQELASGLQTKGRSHFQVGDVSSLHTLTERFDMVYSERALINLKNWEEQRDAIAALTDLLVPGGAYVMCENSVEGLEAINELRRNAGLDVINPPWHNRYMRDAEIEALSLPGVTLEEINYFSSTYYFLSRVVNAWLASGEGIPPSYDAPVNKLALSLPPIGKIGQGRIWVWRKMSEWEIV